VITPMNPPSPALAVVMGVMQGLTEYIPVSSTAHLRITPAVLGATDPGALYTAILQLGTLIAVFVYFARDLLTTFRATVKAPRTPEGLLLWKIGVGSIPIVILGLAFKHRIETDARSLWIVAGALIVVGVLMAVIDARARGERVMLSLGWLDAFLIGCAQACALCPGVSRSGSTICMALLLGMSRREAARFSFLLGIPAVGGAGLLQLKEAIRELGPEWIPSLVIGTVVAGVVGYVIIAWLMRFLGTHRLLPFAVYRVALGAAVIALLVAGVVTANAGA
jgi:undecaprenyl-diphosphatase